MRRAVYCLLAMGLLGVGWYAVMKQTPALEAEESARLPNETAWIQRTFPHFQADRRAYHEAFLNARTLRAAAKTDVFGSWELVGPTNIGGRIVDVAFDPVTPTTIYAAAATGGVFKSTDAGRTWTPIFDEQPVITIGDLAVDPTNPQTLYVGTGEANGGHNNFAGSGIYKSTDGGQTWRFLGLAETTSIGRIRIDPTDPDRIFAAAIGSYFGPHPERGVYRSDDGGQTWGDEPVLFVNDSTGVIDLVMRPDDPNVLLAATWERVRRPVGARLSGPGSGIYKTTDGGQTWERLGAEHGLPSGPAGRIGLALSRNNPDVVYALYTDGLTYQGFYRSDDGGQTWTDADPDGELSAGFRGFSWYFGQVRVHPTDPDLVFVMDVQLMRSINGGATWERRTGTHVDHHAMAFHPTEAAFVIEGNDGGLALSDDAGQSWTRVDDLPVTQFYEIGLDPGNPQRFYGGTQDNGTLRSDGLAGWTTILGGDGFYVLVDPTNPDIVYAESQNGALVKIVKGDVLNAIDGIPTSEPRNWSTPVAMDPTDPQVLYYGTHRIWRTADGAETWQPISSNLTKNLGLDLIGTVTSIAIVPTNTAIVWAATDDGNVWVTSDAGATWQDVTTPNLPFRWITRVVPDPIDENTAYLTFSGLKWQDPTPHVFRTTDRGQTWTDISANLPDAPVNAFAVDPRNPNYLYLGSDVGAFVSTNGGERWEALGTGLPAVVVNDLKIFDDEAQRFLVAGTHGRSMYTLDLSAVPSTPVADEDDAPVPAAIVLEPGYPNPFAHRTTLTYRLAEAATVRLEVFDVLGRRVATLVDGSVPLGTHEVVWNAAGTAAGTYVARLRVETPAGPTLRTMTLVRVR